MQDGDQAGPGAETCRVGGERGKRLRRRAHRQPVNGRVVAEGDLSGGRRQGEDDMGVRDRQQLGLARGKPFRPRCALALRQCRLRHEVQAMRVKPQSSQRST